MSWLRVGSTPQPAEEGFRVPRCAELTRRLQLVPSGGAAAELPVSLDSPLDLIVAPRGQLVGYRYQRVVERQRLSAPLRQRAGCRWRLCIDRVPVSTKQLEYAAPRECFLRQGGPTCFSRDGRQAGVPAPLNDAALGSCRPVRVRGASLFPGEAQSDAGSA
jgi:hypothetical protein